MATIIEVPVILDSTQFSHETHTRSGGLHLSHVIRSIEEDIFKQFKGADVEPQSLEVYRTAGFLFERALYDVILKDQNVERLGEFERDGIIATPDAVNMTVGRGIESKCTWRSMGKDNDHVTDQTGAFSPWWVQMKGYAKVTGLYDWELWAMFMNGNYGANRRPVVRKWEVTFSREEVDATWRMLVNHATWMRESGKIK